MAEFNINQLGDSTNSGSLRHAIIQANNSAGNDVINLAEGTYKLSLEGANENNAQTGDLDIANNGTLTIRGLGNGAVIDAQEIDRVFHVLPGATLILENVTVTGGLTTNSRGGGIFNEGDVTIENSVIEGNQAQFG